MAGNRIGGLKAREKNLAKNPNYYRDLGKLGGQAGNTGGFCDRALARRAGRIGGMKSRRGKGKKSEGR